MGEAGWLAERFGQRRSRLRAVAYRMLGSASDADDAVQETWLKVSAADTREIANLDAWLTTIVARVCLDMLRARRSRREQRLGTVGEAASDDNPEAGVALADALGPALLVVLDTLSPAERIAFVLHDMFDLSFDEIAPIVERNPAAVRQLASRARRRVRGAPRTAGEATRHRRDSRTHSWHGCTGRRLRAAACCPGSRCRLEVPTISRCAWRPRIEERGAPDLAPEVQGAARVADAFRGRAQAASPALIDGEPGAVWTVGAQVRAAFLFMIEHGKIATIDLVMDPNRLSELDVKTD